VRLRALAVLPLLAGSCGTVEKARGHDAVSDLVQARTGVPTGWNQGTPDDQQVAEHVSKLLAPGLDRKRALEIALVNNRELQATYEELGVSQAEMVQAGLLANPRITGEIGFPVRGASNKELVGAVTMDFLSVFLLPLRRSVAAERFAAAVARVADEALKVAAEASERVTHVQAAEKMVELRRTVVDGEQATALLAERQHDAGNITDLDFARERATFAQAKLDLADAERALALAREDLNEELGLFGEQTKWKLAEELPELPKTEPDVGVGLEARAMRQRLDLAAARRTTALVRRMVTLARTYRATGVLEIGADIHQDADGPVVAGPSLTIELPIFDQRGAYIAGLEAQQRQAERQLQAAAIRARAEVRRARARLLIARDMVEHYARSLMPLRERVLSETQLQYNGMQVGLVQLVAAKREQTEAYSGYVRALADYWSARAELERALGGPLDKVIAMPEQKP
jgi:cobalt-zinc-cadmium efflux system outer membrane protein